MEYNMSNTFKVAGVSRMEDGTVKVRFANDLSRVKVLVKARNTDIELMELPEAMEKSAVVKYLLTTELAENEDFRKAIEKADAKYSPVAKIKTPKTPKVKAGKTEKANDTVQSESVE
jgi:Mn-containing catalase